MPKQIEFPILPQVPKTSHMQKIEKQHGGKDIRLIMKEIYESRGSQSAIAKEFGVEQSTIFIWALRLGIAFRTVAEININGMPAMDHDAENSDIGGKTQAKAR